jgi:hypothetical protein
MTGDKRLEVTLSCKHIFHRECAKKRLSNNKSSDCPICQQKDALKHAIDGSSAVSDRQEGSVQK